MQSTVTVSKSNHPRYKYRVRYPDGKERKQKWFVKKTGAGGADEWADEKRKEIAQRGISDASITSDERAAIIKFREHVATLSGEGAEAKITDAVDHYIKQLDARHKSMTCQQVADKLLIRLKTEELSKRHIYDIELRLERFNTEYSDWLACDVDTEIIDDFLESLDLAARTVINYRLAISRLFSHAIILKAVTDNPVKESTRPKPPNEEPGTLTPKQVAKLLSAADSKTVAGLAISFFAGVRRAEIERLDWSEVDFTEGTIEIKAANAKTAKRRFIPMSENLKQWLLPHAKNAGSVIVSPAIWRKGIESARSEAKIKEWPHNAGRHSYASYHLAHHTEAGQTAANLGHPNPSLLYSTYRAFVTAKAAASYWEIKPATEETITNIKSA